MATIIRWVWIYVNRWYAGKNRETPGKCELSTEPFLVFWFWHYPNAALSNSAVLWVLFFLKKKKHLRDGQFSGCSDIFSLSQFPPMWFKKHSYKEFASINAELSISFHLKRWAQPQRICLCNKHLCTTGASEIDIGKTA